MEASGRPSSSRMDINTARVVEIIQRDRRLTVREIASELGLSYGNVQCIVTDELRYSKVCARWIPRNSGMQASRRKKFLKMGILPYMRQNNSTDRHEDF
ncbi:histone-lysine N-methyltransferase SETMAR [Nephila pilipes]|uniref:Histone-lysine N-methyltransferase SETMAR n=1 Tax=Nephila pilipes TaxID=299642 RepID=A0A8X6QNK8_NEPPI|nr:histone-lysine N-methyltransferase SETMAR [Nephila pilipes]